MTSQQGLDNWSINDSIQLLERMEVNLSDDSDSFKTTLSKLDWAKIAFKNFSGETCKLKWLQMSSKLRKYRTLKELVLEAKESIGKPYERKSCKRHPDLPKKPLTAYFRFFKEQRLQYSQMHPKLSNKELTKILSKKYRKLPEHLKQKYIQDFQREKHEFELKMTQFREEHPDQNIKKRPVKAKKVQRNVQDENSLPNNYLPYKLFHGQPPKPPMHGYYKFHEEMWSSQELQNVPEKERMVEIGRLWQRVPQSQKELYNQEAKELQEQYKIDLDCWLKTLSPEDYATYKKISYVKYTPKNMEDNPSNKNSLQSPFVRSFQSTLEEEGRLHAPEIEESSGNEENSHVCVD